MLELDTQQAQNALTAALNLSPEGVKFTPLGGGVSNLVYLIEAVGVRYVAKQALEKLRVKEEWLCTRERLHRECAAMRALGAVLPAGAVPQVVLEDKTNHILVMEAAPPDCETWKSRLLRGDVSSAVAEASGAMHGEWLRRGLSHSVWPGEFGDQAVFEDLRIAPYYLTTAARHPGLSDRFEELIHLCRTRRVALVHGDLSPKNILVAGETVMLIDFEVVHWGDPAFDAAFLFNHLLLKAFLRPDSRTQYQSAAAAYRDSLLGHAGEGFDWLETGALLHLPGLLLARIDGKSPVEYIESESMKDAVRKAAYALFESPTASIEDAFRRALA